MFIVSDSCKKESNVSSINLPSFHTLKLSSKGARPSGENSTLDFITSYGKISGSSEHIAYISGQNKPIVRSISSVKKKGDSATFQAHFPFEAGFSNGLTIAAIVKSSGPFSNAAEVAKVTVAGPGLIEID